MAGRFAIQKLASGVFRSRAATAATAAPPAAGMVPAARYFSRTRMPSVTNNPVKPACVDSYGAKKPPTKEERKKAAWDALLADAQAEHEASQAKIKACFADLNKFVIEVTMFGCFAGSCVLWMAYESEKRRISLSKGQSGSLVCRSRCDGQHGDSIN